MTRTRIVLLLTVFALALAGLGLVGCSSDDLGYEVGDNVAAEWSDGYLYLSEVTEIDGENITVTYLDDDTTGNLTTSQVLAIDEDAEWEVGDRCLAVWAVARFYSGTISEIDGDDYIVEWDDGSSPSLVAADTITEFVEKYADEPMDAVEEEDTSSDDESSDEGAMDADLAGVWTNSGGDVFAELNLAADGTGTATDVDGTTVDCTWTFVDGYLEVILTDTDGTEITTGASTSIVSDSEFIWDAEMGSFVR